MAEHPILFTGPLVQAILDGRKTETRRVMKPQPIGPCKPTSVPGGWYDVGAALIASSSGVSPFVCPYGVPGDTLWVSETWRCTGGGDWKGIIYRADERQGSHHVVYKGLGLDTLGRLTVPKSLWPKWDHLVYETRGSTNWRPSIHMPRWASRITLRVTDVRVQRVQEISEADIRAEGISYDPDEVPGGPLCTGFTNRMTFESLWDSINSKRDRMTADTGSWPADYGPYCWEANPWAWALTFELMKGEGYASSE